LGLPIGVAGWWTLNGPVLPRTRRLAGVIITLGAFALPVAPYAIATGELMHKKSLNRLLSDNAETASQADRATANLAAAGRGIEIPLRMAEQWAQCGGYVLPALAIIGWLWRGVPRSRAGPRLLLVLLAILHLMAVFARGRSYGEISTR